MEFDLGFQGLAILLVIAVVVGLVAQFLGRPGTPWTGLIAGAASFLGGLFVSEVMFAGATEAELQPVIDGLAFDEALLGSIVSGLVVTVLTRFLAHGAPFGGARSA
jgi:phosphatidylserine synthase